MRQGCARGCRVRPWIRLLLTLLMMPPLAAAEEAPFAVAGAGAKDAGQWPNSLATPRLAAGGEARAAVGGAWQRPYAQTGSSEPSEEAPIPFEGAAPSPGARWPYALPFLADQVIKQGYTLPLPRGVSMVYTYASGLSR